MFNYLRITHVIAAIVSVLVSLQLLGCSARNPQRGYAAETSTSKITVLPPGHTGGSLKTAAAFQIPSAQQAPINPTASMQPPGSQFTKYVKVKTYKDASGHVYKRLPSYFTDGSNAAPILVVGRDVAHMWPLVAVALKRCHYQVVAADRSLATYMVTTAQSGHGQHQHLQIYAVRLVAQGKQQTAITVTRQQAKQVIVMHNSKSMLSKIQATLPGVAI